MIIDLKNINKELDSKNFKNILLIDFEGKSDIQTFSMSDGSIPEITDNNLTGEAKNLLNETSRKLESVNKELEESNKLNDEFNEKIIENTNTISNLNDELARERKYN